MVSFLKIVVDMSILASQETVAALLLTTHYYQVRQFPVQFGGECGTMTCHSGSGLHATPPLKQQFKANVSSL